MSVWSPDGDSLYYSDGADNILRWNRTPSDGSMTAVVVASGMPGTVRSMSRDGAWLIGQAFRLGQPDLFRVRVGDEPPVPEAYLRADFPERDGQPSGNGAWLAYAATETDIPEVYVRAFPEPGPAIRVSSAGGEKPLWAPGDSALYYQGETAMMRRYVRLGETVELGEERELFPTTGIALPNAYRNYDLHPDGDRFIAVTRAGALDSEDADAGPDDAAGAEPFERLTVLIVVNWFEELRRLMGG